MNKLLPLLTFSALLLIPLMSEDVFAVSFFTDRSSWEAAMAAATITTDPFDNPIANADVIIFDSGIVSTGVNAGPGALANEVDAGLWEGRVDSNLAFGYEFITWDFPNPITGFGADFVSGCSLGMLLIISNFEGGGDMTIDLGNEMPGNCNGFFGVVSSSSFQSISYTSKGGAELWGMDNLSFGLIPTLVGGELLPIDSTSLLLAGTQSFSWMIPVTLSIIGIGIAIFSKRD